MRVEIKKTYYLDENDKKKIKIWLVQNDMTLVGLADKLDISLSLLSAMLNGTRTITLKTLSKFQVMGLTLLGENENENN